MINISGLKTHSISKPRFKIPRPLPPVLFRLQRIQIVVIESVIGIGVGIRIGI